LRGNVHSGENSGRTVITAYTRYGHQAASTRQRLLQYIPALNAAGIDVRFEPLLDDQYVRALGNQGGFSRLKVARAYLKRAQDLLVSRRNEIIWVYAELFPFLPGWLERLALCRSGRVVYDFDDAFFHNYDASSSALVRGLLGRKLEPLLQRAAACCCGNAYLEAYASRFCQRTMVLPTVVDTNVYRPRETPQSPDKPLVVGWIGSSTTWRYVRPLLPLLAELAKERGIKIRVVGAGTHAQNDRFPGLELVEWTHLGEVADVQAMDVGIMPLPHETWAKGKSGYKLIQYMACGIPVVASPVGVNSEIIRDSETGFLATTPEEWRRALTRLLDDTALRFRMGVAGRERAVTRYSLAVHAPRLVELLSSITSAGAQVPSQIEKAKSARA
jgi:glycosyltransferase involved in cell wall biosynthesis